MHRISIRTGSRQKKRQPSLRADVILSAWRVICFEPRLVHKTQSNHQSVCPSATRGTWWGSCSAADIQQGGIKIVQNRHEWFSFRVWMLNMEVNTKENSTLVKKVFMGLYFLEEPLKRVQLEHYLGTNHRTIKEPFSLDVYYKFCTVRLLALYFSCMICQPK